MGTSSGRLAAAALQRAREQIRELGEAAAWDRWQHERIVWRLADGPDGSPASLFLAGHVLMTAEQERPSAAALLAARYVVGALLLVLTWHGRPPSSPAAGMRAAPGWSPLPNGSAEGDGDGAGPENRDEPLARALAALGQACDQAQSRPALLRELRRLQHGLAQVRGAVIQGEQQAFRRAHRSNAKQTVVSWNSINRGSRPTGWVRVRWRSRRCRPGR